MDDASGAGNATRDFSRAGLRAFAVFLR